MTDEKDPKSEAPAVSKPESLERPPESPAKGADLAERLPESSPTGADLAERLPASPARAVDHPPHVAQSQTRKSGAGVRVRLAYGKDGGVIDAAPETRNGLKARRLLAEYDTTAEVLHAAEALRDAGYKAFEAHSPFPVHGMDAAMGLEDSKLGWIVLVCGLTGVSSAWIMMFWMNGVDYPLIIGGKPPGALPSMVPIMFELTVLLSSFGAVLGMFGLNRLPQHHDLLFYSDRFAAFSNDKFFISVESQDPKFDVQKTRQLLEKTRPQAIEVIETLEEVET